MADGSRRLGCGRRRIIALALALAGTAKGWIPPAPAPAVESPLALRAAHPPPLASRKSVVAHSVADRSATAPATGGDGDGATAPIDPALEAPEQLNDDLCLLPGEPVVRVEASREPLPLAQCTRRAVHNRRDQLCRCLCRSHPQTRGAFSPGLTSLHQAIPSGRCVCGLHRLCNRNTTHISKREAGGSVCCACDAAQHSTPRTTATSHVCATCLSESVPRHS